MWDQHQGMSMGWIDPGQTGWYRYGQWQQVQYQPALYPAPARTTRGTLWGYIDDAGRFAILPVYQYAEDFQQNGLAVVQVHNHSGLINRVGQYVLPPQYNSISPFSEGRSAVIDDRGFWLIDESGKRLTAKPYQYIGSMTDGRALFAITNAQNQYVYGYVDRDGREAIAAQYLTGNDFHSGKAVVQIKAGEFALIGKNGERLQTYPYAFVGPQSEGLMTFRETENGPFGYIDEQGKVELAPQFSTALPFEAGRAVVNTSTDPLTNKYGLITRQGTFVIKPEYNDIQMLAPDRLAVGRAVDKAKPYIGSIYAIVDQNGRFLTDFRYNQVLPYANGLASASDGRHTFFLDRNGRIVQNLPIVPGNGSLTWEGNLIKANVNQRISYYDRQGRLVWQENSVIPLSNQYLVRQETYAPNKDYLVYYPQIAGMADPTAQQRLNRQLKELSQVKPIKPDVQLDYSYTGDFAVEFFRKQLVVLELDGYQYYFGAAHGIPTRIYANADLKTGKIYALKDLFKPGSNYVKVLSDIIGNQIKTDPQYSYVFPDAYKGIAADQPFYVNEEKLFIYFNPYDIAPYAAGFPTFAIPYSQLLDIIDFGGAFWQSFHYGAA